MKRLIGFFFIFMFLVVMSGCDENIENLTITINFDTQGGTTIKPITINPFDFDDEVKEPTREGYTFVNWYTNLDENDPFNFDFDDLTVNEITLYAKWVKSTYELIFKDEDGEILHQESVGYDEFLKESYLESPSKLGYTFNGWDIDLPNKMPDHDVIATATYVINRYRITFETNGGETISGFDEDYNKAFTVQTPTREGHAFAGWFADPNFETPFTSFVVPAFDITLYAQWERLSYNLVFRDTDETILFQTSIIYDDFLEDYYLESPTKLGYTFNGWDIDLPNKMPAHHIVATATYIPNQYTITFETNGANVIAPLTGDYQSSFYVTEPTLEGYTFEGWFTDTNFETPFTSLVIPASDTTLYAKWSKQTYTITFDTRGGNFIDALTLYYMDPIELPIPELLGYEFQGWYVDYDYTQVFDLEVMGSEDIYIVAKWEKVEYQVNYYLLGGTNHEDNPLTVDGSKEIPLYEPSMEGFTFLGWYLNQHFMGEPVASIEKNVRTNIELHAKWQLNQHQMNYVMVENSMHGNVGILNSGEGIIDIVDGNEHTILLTSEHRVFVYGYRNLHQLGTGDYTDYNYPFDITGNFNLESGEYITKIYAGDFHSAALTSNNRLFMWGSNAYGQCAVSVFDTTSISLPRDVTAQFNLYPTEEFMQVSLGNNHSMVTTTHGRIFTFGYNYYGQLGLGQDQDMIYSNPVEITLAFNLDPLKFEYVKHINAHGNGSIAVTSENRVFVWGQNLWGGLGTGLDVAYYAGLHEITNLFEFNEGEEVITAKIAYYSGGVLITSLNRVFVWGENSSGELGIGIAKDREIYPVTEVATGIVFDVDEMLIDATPGDVTMLLTSKGRFFITGYNDLLVNTVIDRPENNRTLFVERSSFFDLDEDEKIIKLSYSSAMKRSVITSKGNILSWGQLHLLGMGDDPKWSTNLPSPINLVQGIYQVDYYFTEEIDDYEHQIEGYQFLGWFTDSSLETPFDLTNMPDEDVVVYGYYMVIGS